MTNQLKMQMKQPRGMK